MSPLARSKPPASISHKKRTGQHHRRSKHYHKVYWPYVAMFLIVVVGLFIGNWQPNTRNGVLAYATQMDLSSLLEATNKQRAKEGKEPLKLSPQLSKAAQSKANDMTARNYWAHLTPEGKEPWTFVHDTGYRYQKAGENLAYGFDSSSNTIAGWMNSPGHRNNLLDNAYSEVGFGFANAKDYNRSGPQTVVVAMYGRPSDLAITMKVPEQSNAPAVTSTDPLKNEPQTLSISRIQTLTAGKMPWITFVVGLTSGVLLAVIVIKHSLAFRKLAREGEEFVIHHPYLDLALVSLVMVGYVLTQGSGVIR